MKNQEKNTQNKFEVFVKTEKQLSTQHHHLAIQLIQKLQKENIEEIILADHHQKKCFKYYKGRYDKNYKVTQV